MASAAPPESTAPPESNGVTGVADFDAPAWEWKAHFDVLARNGGNYKVHCKYCHGQSITGGATRFKNHLLGVKGVRPCLAVPQDVVVELKRHCSMKDSQRSAKRQREEALQAVEREEKRMELDNLSRSLTSGSTKVNSKWKQATIEDCDAAAKLEVTQQAVARMWYRAAIPFHAVAFPEIIDAFDEVCKYGATTGNLAFPMPSAPSLRNQRLQNEVDRIESELESHHKAMEQFGLSLQSDGKDSMSRRHLVNIITTTPMGAEFREVVDVSGQSRDAAHTADVLVKAIERLSELEQRNLVTVITDTPNVNKAAWKLLEEKLPHVQCVPCGAHCANLHFKHIAQHVPEFMSMVEDAKLVMRRCH